MNKKTTSFFLFAIVLSFLAFHGLAADDRDDLNNIVELASEKAGGKMWKHTFNPRQRDQQYCSTDDSYLLHNNEFAVGLSYMQSTELDQKLSEMIYFKRIQPLVAEAIKDAGTSPSDYEALSNRMFEILDNMTFQERRLGANLHYHTTLAHWHLTIQSWYGIVERNFWLDEELREELMDIAGKAFPTAQGSFDINDFMLMRTGIGDTRIRATYPLVMTDNYYVEMGPQVIIPTGAIAERITSNRVPKTNVTDFAGYLFNRSKEIFIAPTHGNNGHYGIGLYTHGHAFHENIELFGSLHVDYLLPATEKRFFMREERPEFEYHEGTNTWRSFSNQVTLGQDGHSLNNDSEFDEYVQQYILPTPLLVSIWPKWSYVMNVGIKYLWRPYWSVYTGIDFYHKDGEVIHSFNSSVDRNHFDNMQEVRASKKEQTKVFCGVVYDGKITNMWFMGDRLEELLLSVGFGGAVAVSAHGVGHDVEINVNIGLQF